MTPALQEFYAYWAEWFAQPMPEKMKQSKEVTGKSGYMPFASESPGFTGQKDPKQYFHWKTDRDHYPEILTLPPELEAACELVFEECWYTANRWLHEHGLSDLALPPVADDTNHVLRIIHYPPHPTGLVGEAHRDFDLLTVSVEGTAPGLEVLLEQREATIAEMVCDVEYWQEQEVGIQIGEMLEIYTEGDQYDRPSKCMGQYRATTHRVRTPPNTERYKAVFFYLPPMDFELRPGFTAQDYLTGPNGVLKRAGTYAVGK